jgi:hypothetical protein
VEVNRYLHSFILLWNLFGTFIPTFCFAGEVPMVKGQPLRSQLGHSYDFFIDLVPTVVIGFDLVAKLLLDFCLYCYSNVAERHS